MEKMKRVFRGGVEEAGIINAEITGDPHIKKRN